MMAAFYFRQDSNSFGCLLPDEKEKLKAFLDTEQKHKPEEKQRNNRRLNFEKR